MATWNYDFATQHQGIDGDHREIVALLDELVAVIDRGDVPRIGPVLDALGGRVADHFRYEEQLMDACESPRAREHKAAHAAFVADVAKFAGTFRQSGLSEPFRLWACGRLVNWFRMHIKTYDIGLARAAVIHDPAAKTAPARFAG